MEGLWDREVRPRKSLQKLGRAEPGMVRFVVGNDQNPGATVARNIIHEPECPVRDLSGPGELAVDALFLQGLHGVQGLASP